MINFSVGSRSRIHIGLATLALLVVAGCSGSPEQRAQGYYERGMGFIAQHDDVKARIELRNAVQAKPDLLPAWRALSQLEERAGNWQAVVSASRQIADGDPKDVDARIRLARFGMLAGAFDEALKRVNEIIDLDGKNTTALALRGAVLLKLNDNAGAIREAESALKIDPANVEAMMVVAAEKMAREDFKGALQALTDVPEARQNEIGVLYFKIRCFEKLKDYAGIETSLRQLINANPKELTFKQELVKFYFSQKRTDDAEQELRSLSTENPKDLQIALELVRFLQVTKGSAAARSELADRIKGGGRVLPYQIALAELNFAEGKFEESRSSLEGLINNEKAPEDVLALRTKLAELLFSRKEFNAVDSLISDILKADARNIAGLKLRASLSIERGRMDDAITDLRQALNDQPRAPDLLSLLAVAYERNGAIELADKQLSDAMKLSNYAPSFGLNYVTFLQRRGLASPAENVLTDLASRNPGNVEILSSLAQVMLARQNWIAAQQIAETIRRIGNQGGVAEQIQAAVLTGQQKFDESIGVLEGAYASNPNAIQPMFALVRTYLQAQKIDRAEAFLQSVLKANPANGEASVLVGLTQMSKNEPDEAEKSFKIAIERQPKNAVGYRALSDFYVSRRNLDAALQVIQAGLREQPENMALRLSFAGILELKGDFEAAIAQYDEMLKSEPGSMVIINNLASLISDHRTDKPSLDRAYKLALSLNKSQVPQFKDTLGWLHFQRGEYPAAVSLLEESVSQIPNNAMIQYHLGMAYKAAGQIDKASATLRKALDLAKNNADQKSKIEAVLVDLQK